MASNSNRSKKGKRGPRKGNLQSQEMITMSVPPADVCNICLNNVARYETNAALSSAAIQANYLIAGLNVMAVSSSTVYSTFYAIKIKKIILYSPANNSTSTSQMAFEWYTPSGSSLGNKPSNLVAGTIGTAFGGKMVIKPPKNTQWDNWITLTSPGGVTAWTWTLPSATVIDIYYHAYVENNDSTLARTVSGASTGANYRMGLDGLALASTNYIAVGYRQI